jgi:hypothetical protein
MLHLATKSHIQSNTPLSQLLWCSNLIFLIRAFNIHVYKQVKMLNSSASHFLTTLDPKNSLVGVMRPTSRLSSSVSPDKRDLRIWSFFLLSIPPLNCSSWVIILHWRSLLTNSEKTVQSISWHSVAEVWFHSRHCGEHPFNHSIRDGCNQ